MTVLTGIPIRRFTVGCVLATALGLGACTGAGTSDQDSSAALETLSASAAGSDTTSTNAGITPLGDSDTAMKTLRPEAPSTLIVTDVRVGSHEGFDRVVFDLTGEGDPGWFVDYTDRPAQQGSGHPIEFQGTTALNVNLDGMAYPFDLGIDDPQLGTVEGIGAITEVQSIGTFEGRSQFIIGMNQQLPYSVQVLNDPQRVVIDIVQR